MVWSVAASIAWVVGLALPRIHIGPSNSIVAHFVAAAVVVPCLYTYFQRVYRWRIKGLRDRSVAFVTFGTFFICANEVLEVITVKFFDAIVNMKDVPYDIIVGYVGVSMAFAIIETSKYLRAKSPAAQPNSC